ncbi:Uncharacterised protein [Mycobacteroides abscessus subsp. abscessus]|nr:Uncharacterised protein [Mycobacteroides abscessus subsp. abscessus]
MACTFLAAACSAVDIMDALLCQLISAAQSFLVVGVSAVNDDISFCQHGCCTAQNLFCDVASRHHHPDDLRRRELCCKLFYRSCRRDAFCRNLFHFFCIYIISHHFMAFVSHIKGKIISHFAQPDYT